MFDVAETSSDVEGNLEYRVQGLAPGLLIRFVYSREHLIDVFLNL